MQPVLNQPLQKEYPLFSVKEISQAIKKVVEGNFSLIKVRGEVSGLKIHSSGHSYFAIKDADALIDAVAWRGSKLSMPLKEGQEVIATGKITTFGARSKYQMVVSDIEETGQGDLYRLFLKRKEELAAEGLFTRPKKELPKFVKSIAVITSPTGAVIHDILHRIKERFPTHIMLYPVAVQGEAAQGQIIKSLELIEKQDEKPDLLIIARGGGSLEDLWAFNEEGVVRALAACSIPVISAIGHETDVTLCDFVADRRAPTPTGAAEMATPDRAQLLAQIKQTHNRYQYWMIKFLKEKILQLRLYSETLPSPVRMVNEAEQKLDFYSDRLRSRFIQWLTYKYNTLSGIHVPSPIERISNSEQRLTFTFDKLKSLVNHHLESSENQAKQLSQRLNESSFEKTLQRGFCLIEDDKAIVRSVKDLGNSDLTAYFHDGQCIVRAVD